MTIYLFLAACCFLLGCGPHMTLMVHPTTGERKECRADVIQHVITIPLDQARRVNCVEEYRAAGFLQASELTAEQRKTITPR